MDPRRKKGIRETIKIGRRLHRLRENQNFLSTCISNRCPPHFTNFSKEVITATRWTQKEIFKRRLKKTENIFVSQTAKLEQLTFEFNNSLNSLKSLFSPSEFISQSKFIHRSIQDFESISDRKRTKKLNFLISNSDSTTCNISIHNDTDTVLPPEILSILSHGGDLATGGRPNTFRILTSMESLLQCWTRFAQSKNLPALTINETKTKINLEMHNLRKCHSDTKSHKTLSTFLDSNPTIRILKVDKSKDLMIMNESEYLRKLNAQFPPDKFIKLNRNPLYADLGKFQRLIRPLKAYLSKSTFNSLRANNALKSCYGIAKRHKPDIPLRIIVSSRNSITSGIETWFSTILKRLIPEVKYSVESTLKFKNNFLNHRNKFDPDYYQIVSFDVIQMYPSINLKTLIPKILDRIYSNPTHYFIPETLDNNTTCAFPPRNIFEPIFTQVLTYFTAFSTPNGYMRQKQGCAMGAKTSALLANIMMGFLETEYIDTEIRKDNILFYNRYVDDAIACIKKTEITRIFHHFNNCDPDLKFTIERETQHSGLNFLDTNVKYDPRSQLYELSFYQKPGKSDALQPYKLGVIPPSQKLGLLSGEIFRMNNCTSNPTNLDIALNRCKDKFIKNGYPRSLINNTIKNIKDSKFEPRKKDPNIEERFYLNLEFTSERVNKIGKRLANMIRKVTPGFKVVLAFKSIRVGSLLTSRLKRKIDDSKKSGIIYKYQCECGEMYIGQTLRTFETRTKEHTHSLSHKSNIRDHFNTCRDFQTAFDLYRNAPDAPPYCSTADFARSHFQIVQTNLHDYRKRCITESFMIKLFKPTINDQLDFHTVDLL